MCKEFIGQKGFFKFKIKLHEDKNTIKSHKHSISNSLMTGICKEEDGKIGWEGGIEYLKSAQKFAAIIMISQLERNLTTKIVRIDL